MSLCKDCDMLQICNGRLHKVPVIVSNTINLFLESQSEKIQFKWHYFNYQPDWFKFFWGKLKENLQDVLKERKALSGDNDR